MTASLQYPNRMGRIMLESLEEVLGQPDLHEVLARAGLGASVPDADLSFESISAVQASLDQIYGPRGGRGIAQRAGRAGFKYGLREYGTALGLTGPEFRLLPLRAKLRTAGQAFAGLLNAQAGSHVRFEETEAKLLVQFDPCPLCLGRHAEDPSCHFMVGLLQESFYWLSSGKIFLVEETQCRARGDKACVIEIQKTPLD